MLQLFVLQLEHDCWFLHLSEDTNKSTVMYQCQTFYEFVMLHPPIKIYETIPVDKTGLSKHTLNAITKTYMEYFGIDHVRGGIYTDVILPEYLRKTVELEIAFSQEQYLTQFSIYDKVRALPTPTLDDFIKQTNSYAELVNLGYKQITTDICTELEWLTTIINDYDYDETKEKQISGIVPICKENTIRYENLLQILATLRDKYYQLDEDKIQVESSVFIKQPRFVFDFFLFHCSKNDLETRKTAALDLLSKFEFMAYTLLNVLDVMEFSCFSTLLQP
jgi:hypothetical protein